MAILGLSLATLAWLNYLIFRIFQRSPKEYAELQDAFKYIYQYIGDKEKYHHAISYFQKQNNPERDIYAIYHNDTVMEDIFLSKQHWITYPEQDTFAKSIGFHIDYNLQRFPIFSRVNFIFNQFPINVEKTAHQLFPSILEKYYILPMKPDLDYKSVMADGQNILIQNLKSKNASEQCFYEAQFLKKSLQFNRKEDCLKIMDIINNKTYMHGSLPLKYILKTDLHQQEGVSFISKQSIQLIQNTTQNGSACGQLNQTWMLQEFIYNPVLYKKRAFTFRIYVLFASTKPWITYIYRRSMLQVCLLPWSETQLHTYRQLCNGIGSKKYWDCLGKNQTNCQKYPDAAPFEEILAAPWFTNLTDFLIEQGYVKNSSWTEEYFYPRIIQQLGYLYNHVTTLYSDTRLCGFHGIDFELDTDLNIWLLDYNKFPSLSNNTNERDIMIYQTLSENFEIIMHYMRQKYQRIRNLLRDQLLPYLIRKSFNETIRDNLHKAIDKALIDVESDRKFPNYMKVNLRDYKKECKQFME